MRFQLCRKCRKYTVQESVQTARIRCEEIEENRIVEGKITFLRITLSPLTCLTCFYSVICSSLFLGLRLSIGEDVEMLEFCLTREKNLLKWMKKYVTSMVQLET